MINEIHAYEGNLPKRHPVLMTFFYPNGNNYALYNSPAEAISPSQRVPDGEWNHNPPQADGRKVIIADTDHIWGLGGHPAWVWKCFTRGNHPIFMDDCKNEPWEMDIFRAMTDTRMFAQRLDLNRMIPSDFLSSTAYCLADIGSEYLVYQPEVAPFYVHSDGVEGIFEVEWFNPHTSEFIKGEPRKLGSHYAFRPPFATDAVLHLKKQKS